MDRILAVDYGRRRIGVAIGDALGVTARGLETLEARNVEDAALAVAGVVCAHDDVARVVVGLPLNMDGSRGEMAQAAEAFADALRARIDQPVVLLDERLTSAQAHRALRARGAKTRGRKGLVDRVAAVLILENYLQQSHLHARGEG